MTGSISRRTAAFALLSLTVFATAPAIAQQPGRIRGQIEAIDGSKFTLKTRDGTTLNVQLAPDARVAALNKATLADLKDDTFIGIAGMPKGDAVEAFSVHIFLPSQRGVVEDRTGPWDARPGSTMTNAYIQSQVANKDGNSFTVKYKGGEQKIMVTPQTVITAVAPGTRDELKAGAQIIIMGSDKAADGTVNAKVLYVSRSGPAPM